MLKQLPRSESDTHATRAGVREAEEALEPATGFLHRLRRAWYHLVVRVITGLAEVALMTAGWLGRKPRSTQGSGCDIMLTGRFDSANWILAFLGPLSASQACGRVWMVSTNPVPALPNVEAVYPPKMLSKILGGTSARLLTFTWMALRKRPHVVGGFHLTVNGIVTAVVGRLAGARSLYFCVGGPIEVRGGGHLLDGTTYGKMETPDLVVEKGLKRIVKSFDTIVTMGTTAARYFCDQGVTADVHVVSGGIDLERFPLEGQSKPSDLVLTARLRSIKRIDVFLHVVKLVTEALPQLRTVVVGQGPLQGELEALSAQLGIEANVCFTGFVDDDALAAYLRGSKIFVLTSDSEGLSLALTEAMICGLPAVVSDIGDLGDLVDDGVNGYLVPRRSPEHFARRIVELLSDKKKLNGFSKAARAAARRYASQAITDRWDAILAKL